MKNIFDKAISDEVVSRIERLTPETRPQWGKMDAAQMLAHCNRIYEMAYDTHYDTKHPPPNAFVRLLLRTFLKKVVVGEGKYRRNSRTAPAFLVSNEVDFMNEKARTIAYMNTTQALGSAHFNGKNSPSFGPLTAREWSNLFYKHIDHHLEQFGV